MPAAINIPLTLAMSQRPPQVKDLIQNMITSRKEEATFNRWMLYLEVSFLKWGTQKSSKIC